MQFTTNGLQHTLSTVMVFQTKEYSRFKMINGNRQLNEKKINRIINEIHEGNDLLEYYPIQVHESQGRLEIMDGQHRFWISKKLERSVYYIVLKKQVDLPEIAKVNSNVEKWKNSDFINCYCQLGNPNYIQLRDIMDMFPVPITTAISMLQSGKVNDGGGTKVRFEQGLFEVSHYDLTVQTFDTCKQFDYAGRYSRQFISAITRMISAGKVLISDLIEKVNKNKADIIPGGDYKEYLTNLENIYNKGLRNRITTY